MSVADGLDGLLLAPPDRAQLLGRASWKPRYIVAGKSRPTHAKARHPSTSIAQGVISARASSFTPTPVTRSPTTDEWLSVYKSKDDGDPIQQWPLNCVADCQVQLVSNRKQGPALPTLVITISDKERRRRSGRATGYVSANKDSGTTTLWFRAVPDDERPTLHDWARFILSRRGPTSADGAVSPSAAAAVSYATHSRDNSDHAHRPDSGSRLLHHKTSTATHSNGTRDGPLTMSSDSPSLRSKRSDASSPSTNTHGTSHLPLGVLDQHYTTVLPLTTSPNEYRGEFIEGWTAAQGRSSALSSPARQGRGSANSQTPFPTYTDASLPPAPGETILDRAFQLGQIPGAEVYIPGQEKLSSIARFDALMREADERKKGEEAARAEQAAVRSAFDVDDSSEETHDTESVAADQGDADDPAQNTDALSQLRDGLSGAPLMSPSAQKALAFIASRHDSNRKSESHHPYVARSHMSHQPGTGAPATSGDAPTTQSSRPHTSHAKSRPNANRTQSASRVVSAATAGLHPPASSSQDRRESSGRFPGRLVVGASQTTPTADKRLSGSSIKGLSLTDFTRRLSNTGSSLLLVQTGSSVGGRRGSAEVQGHALSAPRANLSSRSATWDSVTAGVGGSCPSSPQPRGGNADQRCRWRGNVGVVGSQGGLV